MKKALIVLPTYNEKSNIKTLIPAIFKISKKNINNKWELHILVVDDSSPDGTSKEIEYLQKKYKNLHLLIGKKEGLGKAYVKGFEWAVDNINPYVVFEMDADWSHDPLMIPQFLNEIEKGADFIIGTRYFIKGGSIPEHWALHRKFFSILANLTIRLGLMKLSIRDWTNGYRCIKTWFIEDVIEKVKPYNGYIFQIALLDQACNKNLKIKEIPCQFKDRHDGRSKINSPQYITNIVFYILKNSSFVKFVIVGTTGFIVDIGISLLLVKYLSLGIYISNIISMESAVIWNFILNNFWSFSHKKLIPSFSNYLKAFCLFNITSLGSFIIQLSGIFILSNLFGNELWSLWKIITILFIVIPYSYFIYNRFIWKKQKSIEKTL